MVRKRCQNSDFLGEKFRIILQIFKIGPLQEFEKNVVLFSCTMLRKKLYSDQNWFLRPFSPLIGGIYMITKSGLIFSCRASEGSFQRLRKSPLSPLFPQSLSEMALPVPATPKISTGSKKQSTYVACLGVLLFF